VKVRSANFADFFPNWLPFATSLERSGKEDHIVYLACRKNLVKIGLADLEMIGYEAVIKKN